MATKFKDVMQFSMKLSVPGKYEISVCWKNALESERGHDSGKVLKLKRDV